MATDTKPRIPESFFELRQIFSSPWIDRWVLPNPFISQLHAGLSPIGVELTDFAFNKETSTLGDIYLNVTIRRLNAAARIGLDSVTFAAANPAWELAPELVKVFDRISEIVAVVCGAKPHLQKAVLAFHVTSGTIDFRESTGHLVSGPLAAGAIFCGVSLHRSRRAIIIDKSQKYEDAAFVRLERTFSGDAFFSEVATSLYEDELSALRCACWESKMYHGFEPK